MLAAFPLQFSTMKLNRFPELLLCLLFNQVSSAADVRLHGAGATFPSEIYEAWMPVYGYSREEFVHLDTEYDEVGSLRGKMYMMTPPQLSPVEYGATDAEMNATELANNPDLAMYPATAGAVVMAYNLPNILGQLILSRDNLVGIYNGTITWWNDTNLQETNPSLFLPSKPIRVVARGDYSGTTEIFTRALSTFSEEWNSTYGTFPEGLDEMDEPINWDPDVVELYGRTTRGMSGIIFSYRYSIGYITIAEALITNWTYALMVNSVGNIVDVDPIVTKAVMEDRAEDLSEHLTGSLVDSSRPDAYPILGYSYFIVRLHQMQDCSSAVELLRYSDWLFYDSFAGEQCTEMLMTQIPPTVAEVALDKVLKVMTCQGQNVYEMAIKQKEEEENIRQDWQVALLIAGPICSVLVIMLIAYIIFQQLMLRRAVLTDDWKIPITDIKLRWDRERGRIVSRRSLSKAGSVASTAISTMSGISDLSQGWAMHVVKLGQWGDRKVSLRKFPNPNFQITKRRTKITALNMRNKVVHSHVLRFYGVTFLDDTMFLVSELAGKGSMADVLQNSKYKLDDNFKFSMALDVGHGLDYLHSQGFIHGNLNADCCLLDNRWNAKVSNWEYHKLQQEQEDRKTSKVFPFDFDPEEDPHLNERLRFWYAPEILRSEISEPTKKSDVYSFGFLLVEIFTRDDPFSELTDSMDPNAIVEGVKRGGLRPDVNIIQPETVRPIMSKSWEEKPSARPTTHQVVKMLQHVRPSKKSVVECMMETLEGYVLCLEEKVGERTAELAAANQSLEGLLHQILPPSVADSLSKGLTVVPEHFDMVTIFFSDIVGFTSLSASSTPLDVVTLLNDLYTVFDSIIDTLDCYKVETIGDAYMCVSGCPLRNGIRHASSIATMALQLILAVEQFKMRHKPDDKLRLRAGIHSGPVVAGVVGLKMPRYCLFGDTVNTASRMESTSLPMRIQVSQTTRQLLEQIGGYTTELRGDTDVKGKGTMKTYFLNGLQEGVLQLPQTIPDMARDTGRRGSTYSVLSSLLVAPPVNTTVYHEHE